MSLKSLINKRIIKTDLKRYWYLSAAFAVSMFLVSGMSAMSGSAWRARVAQETFLQTSFCNVMFTSVVIICIFGVLIPALIFSYIHHKSASAAMHGLPLRRETHYVSHLISCFVLAAGAIAVNIIVLLTMIGKENIMYNFSDIFIWAGLSMIYCLVVMSFTTLITMITGNVFASIAIPYAIAALPGLCEYVFYYICGAYLFGFSVDYRFSISKFLYLDYVGMIEYYGIIKYIVIGIIALAAGLVCYKKRKIENLGSVVVFKALNPVFLYGVAVCAGLCGFIYVSEITDIKTLCYALPCGIIGIIVARMIIQQSFRPNKLIKPITVYVVFIGVLYAFTGLDITGYEKRLPNANDVMSVNVVGDYQRYNHAYYNDDNTEVYLDEEAIYNPEVTDIKDIEKIIELHNVIITSKSENDKEYNVVVPIEYTLKQGKKLSRAYNIKYTQDIYTKYSEVMNIPVVKGDRFPIITDKERQYFYINLNSYNRNFAQLNGERMQKFLEALKKDIEKAEYRTYNDIGAVISADIATAIPSKSADKNMISDKNKWYKQTNRYNIYSSYVNTISLLKEWDMYQEMLDISDINKISIEEAYNRWEDTVEVERVSTEVTDKETINKIMEYINKNVEKTGYSDQTLRTFEFNISFDDNMNSYMSVNSSELPPGIK